MCFFSQTLQLVSKLSAPQFRARISPRFRLKDKHLWGRSPRTCPPPTNPPQHPDPPPPPRQQLQQMPASQLPQWLFGFAGLIPDGFGSRVIRLSPKGQRACQVSPHINVVLLTPWADSTARQRGREEHWSGVVGGVGTLGWRETRIVPIYGKKKKKKSFEESFFLGIYYWGRGTWFKLVWLLLKF